MGSTFFLRACRTVLAVVAVVVVFVLLSLVLGGTKLTPVSRAESCQRPAQAASARHQVRQHVKALDKDLRKARTDLRRTRKAGGASAAKRVDRLSKRVHRALTARQKWQGVTATLDTTQSEFKLGRDVNAGTHSIRFSADRKIRGPVFLSATAMPFSQSTGGRELTDGREQGPAGGSGAGAGEEPSAAAILVWAVLDSDRKHGTLYFCINPDKRLSTSASGQFTGSFAVDDPRLGRLDVPVTLDMPYPRWDYVLLAGFATCLLCSAYTFYLRRPSLPACLGGTKDQTEEDACVSGRVFRGRFGFVGGWLEFYADILGVLTLTAGFVGATTAFVAQYVASDTWDASTKTWITFVGAIATAFIASATAGKLAQNEFWPQKLQTAPTNNDPNAPATNPQP